MWHGQCISTAVRMMDRGASRLLCSNVLLPAHNRPEGWEGGREDREGEREGEGDRGGGASGKFVPWQELLSLSLGHTWFHQGARPSFIIDANLFRAD